MKYEVGEYLILKYEFWTHSRAKKLIIKEVVYEKDAASIVYRSSIVYRYEIDNEDKKRCRDFDDFEGLELVPYSPLMEELI